ncbi:flagellar basal-body MS-ring/collar protein FliF [Herminiimonas sp. CN]|uniref:flagellar basal-body MS-ring/collar protein FliF n=1 Tax=Herminiimonas sp. CN TaxID=1349818 RepID=UPI00047359EB|nr:flagellar basal-body MS-ring/collar protein FliF [Herminiimonas sp. CN]
MNAAATGADPTAANKFAFLEQLRANPRLPMMIGAAIAIAAVIAFWLWSSKPDYKVLYSNLSDRDGGAIIASLQQMNIPYKFAEGGGAVLVEADKVPEARLRLAAQGLPKGGSVGFELMDNQKFGTSQFAEQLNYQRSLEGELARSIESISAVESARVHLALPKPSLFVRGQQKPSASVILTLQRGRSIDEGQVSAMVHLVSSSVPELNAKSVTVVDQAGNLLSAANAGSRGLDVSQLKYTQEIEQNTIRRIEAILQPIVGAGNVKAQVTAEIDFATVEHTDEKYRPNQDPGSAAVRSQQSSESNQQGTAPPGGVPGALSNQPPINPVAPITTPGTTQPNQAQQGANGQLKLTRDLTAAEVGMAARSGGPSNVRKDVTTNYELDRSIRHIQQDGGGVKRLSVAVVVNYRDVPGKNGKPLPQALPPAELEQVKNLVKEAMGYSAERGDSLNVVNSQFASAASEPELPWWRQPANIELAKFGGKYLLLALLALFLWFAVARPLLRKHLQPEVSEPAVGSNIEEAPTEDPEQLAQEKQRQADLHQGNMQHAQQTAEKDPQLVAMVIKHWMNAHE